MSNFSSLDLVTETLVGTAPARFVGSTPDSYATIIAAGYLNDKAKLVKANDVFDINYLDVSSFPLNVGESSVFGSFKVQYDPTLGNWNLTPSNPVSSIITSYGLHSASYSNAGGSATAVISDAAINPNSVVQLRIKSSANSVAVEKVLPGNGQLMVLMSGDPGASVLEYISFLPSLAFQNLGLYGAQYSNAGGSATLVISNPNITAAMIGQANLISSANAVKVESVLAAAGSLTIVFSADPGVSVVSYMAVLASSALSADGLYAAQYSNAGGSTTISITDANISASSVVVADFSSQANASYIEKVTPGAGSLTLLVNADPGVSVVNYSATPNAEGIPGAYLLAANNLSDVASAASSATNLGLGTGNSPSFAGASILNLKYGATPVAQVDPASCTITAAAGASNHCTITIQLKDGGGNNMTRVIPFKVYLATDATGLTLQSAASTGYSVSSGGVKDPTGSTTITQGLAAFSSASGGCVVDLLDTGKGTGNLILMFANGFKASAAITSGSYG